MNKSHRDEYHRAWSRLTPPLRPHPDVVQAVKQTVGEMSGRTLLLGVTPELADIAPNLVAVDIHYSMVAHIWPGNTSVRSAVVGNWLNTNFVPSSFSTCIGDGSITAVRYPDQLALLFAHLAALLRRGGKFICRVYLPPEPIDTIAAVRDAAMSGMIRNFHAFKWRLAMAIAAQTFEPNIRAHAIFEVFTREFDDRHELVRATGWDRDQIDTIDFYKGSSGRFSFPTRKHLLSVIPDAFSNVRFVPSGTYELAECCPLLVMEKC